MKINTAKKSARPSGLLTVSLGSKQSSLSAGLSQNWTNEVRSPVSPRTYEVVLDNYKQAQIGEYFNTLSSAFVTGTEQPNAKVSRLEKINHIKTLCKYDPNTLLINCYHDKSECSILVGVKDLNIIKVIDKSASIDALRVSNYICLADEQTSKIRVLMDDGSYQVCQSQAVYRKSFFKDFSSASRVLTGASKGKYVAYISEANEKEPTQLHLINMNGRNSVEYSMAIPSLNHSCIGGQFIHTLTSTGEIRLVSFSSSKLTVVRSGKINEPEFVFTTIASEGRTTVISATSSNNKQNKLFLLDGFRVTDQLLIEDARIFPVHQIQLVRNKGHLRVLATEYFERYTLLQIKQGRFTVITMRHKFVIERLFGICLTREGKESVSIIYGSSFFKKITL